jgi:hypothetical protein
MRSVLPESAGVCRSPARTPRPSALSSVYLALLPQISEQLPFRSLLCFDIDVERLQSRAVRRNGLWISRPSSSFGLLFFQAYALSRTIIILVAQELKICSWRIQVGHQDETVESRVRYRYVRAGTASSPTASAAALAPKKK